MTTIIIINYKNEQLTIDYITKELSKLTDRFNVIVVNNASTPESDHLLSCSLQAKLVSFESFEEASNGRYVVSSKENLGFAKGNNLGTEIAVKYLNPEYLLFSNNDILINETDIVCKMIAKFEKNNKIGILGPKVMGLQGELQSPEPYISFLDRYCWMYLSTPFISKKAKIKRFNLDYTKNAKEGFHYKVSGSFFMVKACDFMQCRMMDPQTFLYAEETILSERMKRIGKETYYLPTVSVIHAHGLTTKNTIGKKGINRYMIESEKYYYRRYMNTPKWKLFIGEMVYRLYCKFK